jgi:hypothetical protein
VSTEQFIMLNKRYGGLVLQIVCPSIVLNGDVHF